MRNEAFSALANPRRRTLLEHLSRRPRPVGELAEIVGVSQPATSQHLGELRRARLVRVEVDGRRRIYHADLATLSELRHYLDGYWTNALDRLERTIDDAGHVGDDVATAGAEAS